jgi:hypothetical protein
MLKKKELKLSKEKKAGQIFLFNLGGVLTFL